MDFDQLQADLEAVRPDDSEASDALEIIITKLGQMSMGRLRIDAADEPSNVDAYRRDLVAGLIVAAGEYCAEHDLDMDTAVEERIEQMKEAAAQLDSIEDAQTDGDAEALADALTGDESGDDEDDSDPIGFQ